MALLALTLPLSLARAEVPPRGVAADQAVVGEVSLVLGSAVLEYPGARRQQIQIGTAIKVGSRISTAVNGHVHIRFIDQALISIRPNSLLEIENYDYNPDRPELSSIKFKLEEGVARAISGSAAKVAKDRFRLNTPIAAIGVRGTDFVVSTSQGTVRALVNQGAIVMAPYSAECTAEAFGPCSTNAVELTATSLQIIEFNNSTVAPRLLPATHELETGAMRDDVQLAVSSTESKSEAKTSGTNAYVETEASRKLTTEIALAAVPPQPAPIVTVPVKPPESVIPPTPEPEPATPPTPVVITPVPDFTPPAAVPTPVLTSRQLVWGHYSGGIAGQERISLPFLEAKSGREVTVGNYEYALFRVEGDSPRVDAGLGVISFALHSAQAFYNSSSGVLAMQVNGGNLAIDFNNNRFETGLRLNSSATGIINFSASGRLFDGGYFNNKTELQHVAGAVSLDGKEAGYFFEQQLDTGSIKGLTLWNRPGL